MPKYLKIEVGETEKPEKAIARTFIDGDREIAQFAIESPTFGKIANELVRKYEQQV